MNGLNDNDSVSERGRSSAKTTGLGLFGNILFNVNVKS